MRYNFSGGLVNFESLKAITTIFLCLLSLFLTAQTEEYLSTVTSQKEFDAYEGKPLSSKYGDVSALKVVYRLKDQQMFYLNSSKYQYHLNFCEDYLGYYKGSFNFNYENYTTTEVREFLLATINHYKGQDLFTLEFSVTDQISIPQIEQLYQKILNTFELSDSIKVFLNTEGLEKRFLKSGSKLPYTTVNEIYANQSFQSIQEGVAYGKLRFVDVTSGEVDQLWPEDIVVLKGVPNELSLISGLIASDFQTPLSHISILCKNRKTPFMAIRSVWNDEKFRILEGKYVRLKITAQGYELHQTTKDSAEAFYKDRKQGQIKHELKADFSDDELLPVESFDHRDKHRIGAKAANFGELNKICSKKGSRLKVPENAFAIPFYFYKEHLASSGADLLIRQLNALPYDARDQQLALLKLIQKKIKKQKVDSNLVVSVEARMRLNPNFTRYRFRSSTNAEDIEGFNGAGLYTSKTAVVGDKNASVERAIRSVWASVWNIRAYYERAYFGIDQSKVAMGILVHRSFPDEKANGVAITKNIYRPKNLGFVLNIQVGDIPVVNPPLGVVCDQLVCYSDTDNTFYNPKRIVEYISKSSENNGEGILDGLMIVKLTRELAIVKKHFYRKVDKNWVNYDYESFALDIEFKIDQNNQIYIKQARPFN